MNDLNNNFSQNDVKSQTNRNIMSDEGSDETQDLNQVIRRLEFQQAQLELGLRFEKNMEIFKIAAPNMYEEYKDYQPTELQLVLEEDCSINLVNIDDHSRVYNCDPEIFSKAQVADYLKRPVVTDITLVNPGIANEDYLAINIFDEAIRTFESLKLEKEINLEAPIGLVLMIGCGLGFQIRDLIRQLDITNLCIVDPHKDCFYASLHTVDWSEICEYFSQPGRFLKFHLGPENARVDNIVGPLVEHIGLHNAIHTFVYRHINSEQESAFTTEYQRIFHQSALGIGFFDDERISLAHTRANINKGIKFFKPNFSATKMPPAFIVGNGPSLDALLPFLEKEQKNAVIFSSGTTLGSLYKAGIKPDFHVEMERVAIVGDWIDAGTDAEYRKGIVALGLNTVHPESLRAFDRIGVAKKENDLGAAILDNMMKGSPLPSLPSCNPTVTNCSLSYALMMGFTEIYFIGVDLGMTEDGKHHSENSLYADIEKKDKSNLYISCTDESLSYKVPGNFSETVITDPILDQSRTNIEFLLSFFIDKYSINAYNPGRGARIKGADAVEVDEITISDLDSNKADIIDRIYSEQFVTVSATESDFETDMKIFDGFFSARPHLKLKEHPKNIKEAVQELNRVYRFIKSKEQTDPTTMMLLRGTIHILFTLLYKSMIFTHKPESFRKAYRAGWLLYSSFLSQAYDIIQKDPFALDNTVSKAIDSLTK